MNSEIKEHKKSSPKQTNEPQNKKHISKIYILGGKQCKISTLYSYKQTYLNGMLL